MVENRQHLKLLFVGRTGDGKTQLCASIAKFLGATDINFNPTNSAESHRCPPLKMSIPSEMLGCMVSLIDTPGLCDTDGSGRDDGNLKEIEGVAVAERPSAPPPPTAPAAAAARCHRRFHAEGGAAYRRRPPPPAATAAARGKTKY